MCVCRVRSQRVFSLNFGALVLVDFFRLFSDASLWSKMPRDWNSNVDITLIPMGKRARSQSTIPTLKRVATAPTVSSTLPQSELPPMSETVEQKNTRLERELASVKEERTKREKAEQRILHVQLQTQQTTSSNRRVEGLLRPEAQIRGGFVCVRVLPRRCRRYFFNSTLLSNNT